MSPPANLGLLTQRMNQHTQAPSLGQSSLSLPSHHKRSLSFNHHLSYNQYTGGQHPVTTAHAVLPPAQPQSLPSHSVALSGLKSSSVQMSSAYPKIVPLPLPPQPQSQSLPTPPPPPALSANTTTNARNAKGNPKGTEAFLVFLLI